MMQAFESKNFLELAETTHCVHQKSTMPEILTQQALFRCFLLAYGKCFTSSGKGRTSLDPKNVFATSPELKTIHYRIMELRHTFAAHNDESGLDDATIKVKETSKEFVISHFYSVATPLNEFKDYKLTIKKLEEYIITKANNQINFLEKKLNKKIKTRDNKQVI
ncbi:hypothetical protein [Dickeya oryzae]|uniref:hypothetical protein n=1 Tax=Dickeya oryzae TaxID=1240404 RepID=UPI0005777827|nr:hypothetical protein [Dickeya oryzae]MBP2848139.1 hypothetical protein [Dickeya oryzae]